MINFKIRVNSTESQLIQQLLFIAGYSWANGKQYVMLTESRFLYFYYGSLTCGDFEYIFYDNPLIEINFEQFLNEIEKLLNL